ncbi:MAG: hypothetical protein IPL55_15325 [Saprospiraceae bacterium]|jgi:hypothetical protein|nr:hypothetical protein [Saprospiraceae bacterium]MBL0026422.1 hypothetical protein [Saprospiraceae bacterium]
MKQKLFQLAIILLSFGRLLGQSSGVGNLVPNPQFELMTPSSQTYTYYNPQMECFNKSCTEMQNLFRVSPAQQWTLWLGSLLKNSCVLAELVRAGSNCIPMWPNYVMGNMMHVKTTVSGSGIVNSDIPAGNTSVKVSCWVYVIKGKVSLGYGPTGNPIVTVVSKSNCKWERLEVTKSGTETCNQIVIYATNQLDAEFYVDAVSVNKF